MPPAQNCLPDPSPTTQGCCSCPSTSAPYPEPPRASSTGAVSHHGATASPPPCAVPQPLLSLLVPQCAAQAQHSTLPLRPSRFAPGGAILQPEMFALCQDRASLGLCCQQPPCLSSPPEGTPLSPGHLGAAGSLHPEVPPPGETPPRTRPGSSWGSGHGRPSSRRGLVWGLPPSLSIFLPLSESSVCMTVTWKA